jgi:hypothetical protein
MTLAIGMQCQGGLILAADTRLAYDSGPISEGGKLTGFCSKTGTFAIAQSSYDAHAADTLMSEVRTNIETADPQTFTALERAIKKTMARWYAPVYDNRPVIQLLFGASLQQEKDRGLYFCEPPSTVSPVWGYKAIGDGRSISDPIYSTWFQKGSPWPLHASLCQLSYMMHKGKELLPASIGGDTDVAVLTEPATVPYWIERLDMKTAEGHGVILDGFMTSFASLLMSENRKSGKAEILRILEGLYQWDVFQYAAFEFRCQFPDKTIRQ